MNKISSINLNTDYAISFGKRKKAKNKKKTTQPIKYNNTNYSEAARSYAIGGFDSIRGDIQTRAKKTYDHMLNNVVFPFIFARNLEAIGAYDSYAFNYSKSDSTADGIAILNSGKDYTLLKNCEIISDDNFIAEEAAEHSEKGYTYYNGIINYQDNVLKLIKGDSWKFDDDGNLLEQRHLNV